MTSRTNRRAVLAEAAAANFEPRYRIAQLFQDEGLRSVFRSAEFSMPEVPVLPASPVWEDVLDENGFVPAPFAILRVIDRSLSEIRYRRINGVMIKDDRQNYHALEKLRAIAITRAGKEVTQ